MSRELARLSSLDFAVLGISEWQRGIASCNQFSHFNILSRYSPINEWEEEHGIVEQAQSSYLLTSPGRIWIKLSLVLLYVQNQ